MDKTVRDFAEFAFGLAYDAIRPAALHAAKRSILDSLGCAIGSMGEAPVQALVRIAKRVSGTHPATLLGTTITTSPEQAAFVNGSMIRFSDFSDDYFGLEDSPSRGDVGPHPSDTLGAIFAATEATQGSGKALLLGTVIAYEVDGQITERVRMRTNGWDYTPLHAMASALGAGRIMGLSQEQLAHALRIATTSNLALGQTRFGELSHWKSFAGPYASRAGLLAAELAAEGITGPELAFEGQRGFMRQMNAPFELAPFGGGNVPFRIENTYFKSLPLRYELQTPVELALRVREALDVNDIAAIKVFMDERSLSTRANEPRLWDPMTRETADHSGPYLIGAAMIDGVINHDTFDAKRFRDPSILALVDRIEAVPDATLQKLFPWRIVCRFEITLKSGETRVFTHENAKGHPRNPMSDGDLEAKFLGQTAQRLSEARGREIMDRVWSLDEAGNLAGLMKLLASAERQAARTH